MIVRDLARKAYGAAREAMEKGDYDMARAALRWARRADAGNALFIHAEAELERRVGNYYEAERLYRRLIDFAERSFGVGHINTVALTSRAIELYEEMGRPHQANLLRDRTIRELEPHSAANGSICALERFARLCIDGGRPTDALAIYVAALKRRQAVFGRTHSKVKECFSALMALRARIRAGSDPSGMHKPAASLGAEIIWRRREESSAALSA